MRLCLEVWDTDYGKINDSCILAEKLGYYAFYYGAISRDRFGLLECHLKFMCYDSDDKTRTGHNLPDSSIQKYGITC